MRRMQLQLGYGSDFLNHFGHGFEKSVGVLGKDHDLVPLTVFTLALEPALGDHYKPLALPRLFQINEVRPAPGVHRLAGLRI